MVAFAFDDDSLFRQFCVGLFLDVNEEPEDEIVEAIRRSRPVEELLNALRLESAEARSRATQMLWYLWMSEAGDLAYNEMLEGVELIDRRNYDEAIEQFTILTERYPDFAEAYNKRATAHYLNGDFAASAADCLNALRRNLHHFGAWHGFGLCCIHLEQHERAIVAFRAALRIQPYATENLRLLAYCRGRSSASHGR